MEKYLERAKFCPSLKRLKMCTKAQLMVLADDWEIPLKPNDTKEFMIDEIQDTLLERSTNIGKPDVRYEQVPVLGEKVKQQLEELSREVATKNGINVASAGRMIPKFREEEPREFFKHFEKLAAQMRWPERHWSILVQGKMVGKARRTCNDLLIEESQEYTNIKETILRVYCMVPEADRVKLRQLPW